MSSCRALVPGTELEAFRDLVHAGGWRAPVHLHAFLEEARQQQLVHFLAQELHQDQQVTRDWRLTEDHQGMVPSVSQCARYAPRFGGANRRFALSASGRRLRFRVDLSSI